MGMSNKIYKKTDHNFRKFPSLQKVKLLKGFYTLNPFIISLVILSYLILTFSFQAALFNAVLGVVYIVSLSIGYTVLLRSQTAETEFQNKQLNNTLSELQRRQFSSSLMSQELLAIVNQLNDAVSEQASGSNQQVLTVSGIANAIEELSHTAANISEIAGEVNTAVEEIDRQSHQIEETTGLSVARNADVINSMQETVEASSTVSDKYQLLLEALQTLSTKSQAMRRILQLMSGIASETHLLSLTRQLRRQGQVNLGLDLA
jgi:methyl-accepting chemotaxis protein